MNGPNYIPKNFPIERPKSNMLKTFGEKIQTPPFHSLSKNWQILNLYIMFTSIVKLPLFHT